MAELVDALGSGPSGGNTVEVRVLFWAPPTVSRFTQGKGTGARSVPERISPTLAICATRRNHAALAPARAIKLITTFLVLALAVSSALAGPLLKSAIGPVSP